MQMLDLNTVSQKYRERQKLSFKIHEPRFKYLAEYCEPKIFCGDRKISEPKLWKLQWDGKLPEDWERTILKICLFQLRGSKSSKTGFTPAKLVMGRDFVMPLQFQYEEISFEGSVLLCWSISPWGCKMNVQNVEGLMQLRKDVHEKALALSKKKQLTF